MNNKYEILKISKKSNKMVTAFMSILTIISVAPLILIFIVSITDNSYVKKYGYSFFPRRLSIESYKIIINDQNFWKSLVVSVLVTVLGTIIGLFLMSTFAYSLSRKKYAYRSFLNKFSTIPMLFNGGMLGSYVLVINILGLRNSVWALILPLCMSTFSVMILRTFYTTNIPESLVESAYIDGAKDWMIFVKIALPLSLPGLSTIALFLVLGFWNDWISALLYTDGNTIIPLQYLLMKIDANIDMMIKVSSSAGNVNLNSIPTETIKMAMVFVNTIPILIVYPFFQKYFISGLTLGGVKE